MNIQDWFALGMKRQLPSLAPPGLKQLDIGCGNAPVPGAFGLDWPDWIAPAPIPCHNAEYDTIWAHHFLEHLDGQDAIFMLREMQRVLKVGGSLNIVTPYYNSHLQAEDLDHKSRYNEDTWKTLFSNKAYDKNHDGWKFTVHACFIIGIVERNLALFTQLVRTP